LVSLKLEECLGPDGVASLSDPQGTILKYVKLKTYNLHINVFFLFAELYYE